MGFVDQAQRTLRVLHVTPGWQRLKELRADLDDETVSAIVEEAAHFSEAFLAPLNTVGDRTGARLVDGRVTMPPGFGEAYRRYAEAGWLGMDVAVSRRGQGLPLTLAAACGPLFERGCVALMMAAGSTRAAAHLLSASAPEGLAEEWVPKLLGGEWSATICISEADAGSDVGRIRTRAECRDGIWRITGQKTWISFGDHDMSRRIGHCLLARTSNAPGTRGISLFLVPSTIGEGSNGISVDRIEEKMGLHASPTCALSFTGACGVLIGDEGRGLPQLFSMIELMRLQTGCQGLGIASAAVDVAEIYALERRQGGLPDQPPLPIAEHPDVRRQLRTMRLQTEILRAAILELATVMDLARLEEDEALRQELSDLTGWMLPLVKNFGAATGFEVSNAAIQVLGGAGYTRDWPLEQYLRDARVMTIYEGTAGMQGLDFLTRRLWRDEGRGLSAFQRRATAELQELGDEPRVREALHAIEHFAALSRKMTYLRSHPEAAFFEADAYLRAGWQAFAAWMAARLDTGLAY